LEPFTPGFYRRLQQLKIHTKRAFLGSRQGIHLSTRRGHGLEFADFRLYAPGDDFRYIDWGAYGRTDRLYVRQFREEQDLDVLVLIDSSASMAFDGKFERACLLGLALGYVALTDGDTVRYVLLGKEDTPRYRGPRALKRAFQKLGSIEPGGDFDIVQAVRQAASRQRNPGKCFVISDFMFSHDAQNDLLKALRSRNFDVSVLQILSPNELKLSLPPGSAVVVDAESGMEIELELGSQSAKEYAALLAKHIAWLEDHCHRHGIAHVLISSDEETSDIVLTRLPAAGVLS
ncbi:MAG: DUF58 domain-containing protein, partial [Bdellovibrionales bacterium]|nr:DUF58 domain-containing protein [Bdellovibrionales bacterium]